MLVNFYLCNNIFFQEKTQKRKLKELQTYSQELENELTKYHEGVTNVPSRPLTGHSLSGSALPPITPHPAEPSIAKDNSNKSSQTVETAFVPCESCHRVQLNFKAVGDAMGNLCKSQGLPSALTKFRRQLKGIDWYSANDLMRWSVEQAKDLERIDKVGSVSRLSSQALPIWHYSHELRY